MTDKTPEKTEEPKESFRQQLSDMFEDMWETIGKHHTGVSGKALSGDHPAADLSESKDDLNLCLEVPGMDADDIQISIANGRLVVSGEKDTERRHEGRGYVFRECSHGSFTRTFTLPRDAREEDVTAELEKGVLTIRVPRSDNGDGETAKTVAISAR